MSFEPGVDFGMLVRGLVADEEITVTPVFLNYSDAEISWDLARRTIITRPN